MTTNTTRPTTATRRRLIIAGTLLATAATLTLGAVAPANAAGDTYVAIAWSPDNGDHGWANNQPSFPLAAKVALLNCRKFGGDKCTVVVSARDACAALFAAPPAGDNPNWGPAHVGTGPTLDAAQGAATDPSQTYDTGIPLIIRCSTGSSGQGQPRAPQTAHAASVRSRNAAHPSPGRRQHHFRPWIPARLQEEPSMLIRAGLERPAGFQRMRYPKSAAGQLATRRGVQTRNQQLQSRGRHPERPIHRRGDRPPQDPNRSHRSAEDRLGRGCVQLGPTAAPDLRQRHDRTDRRVRCRQRTERRFHTWTMASGQPRRKMPVRPAIPHRSRAFEGSEQVAE